MTWWGQMSKQEYTGLHPHGVLGPRGDTCGPARTGNASQEEMPEQSLQGYNRVSYGEGELCCGG